MGVDSSGLWIVMHLILFAPCSEGEAITTTWDLNHMKSNASSNRTLIILLTYQSLSGHGA